MVEEESFHSTNLGLDNGMVMMKNHDCPLINTHKLNPQFVSQPLIMQLTTQDLISDAKGVIQYNIQNGINKHRIINWTQNNTERKIKLGNEFAGLKGCCWLRLKTEKNSCRILKICI